MIDAIILLICLGIVFTVLFIGLWRLRSESFDKRGYIDPKEDPEDDKDKITFVKYKGYVLPMRHEERAYWFKKATSQEMDRHLRKLRGRVQSGEIMYVRYKDGFAFVTPEEASRNAMEVIEFKPQRNWVPSAKKAD